MSDDTTLPRLLRLRAAEHPGRHALREKRHGIWQPVTWKQYEERVRGFAERLATLGFERGDTLAVLGDNRPEWVIAELAAQSLGGNSLGLHPDSSVEEVAHLLALGGARLVVVEGQEQVDKLVALKDRGDADAVEQVIFYDARGLERYEQPYLSAFTGVETARARGRLVGGAGGARPRRRRRDALRDGGDHRQAEAGEAHPRQPAVARRRAFCPRIPFAAATRSSASCRLRGSASR